MATTAPSISEIPYDWTPSTLLSHMQLWSLIQMPGQKSFVCVCVRVHLWEHEDLIGLRRKQQRPITHTPLVLQRPVKPFVYRVLRFAEARAALLCIVTICCWMTLHLNEGISELYAKVIWREVSEGEGCVINQFGFMWKKKEYFLATITKWGNTHKSIIVNENL